MALGLLKWLKETRFYKIKKKITLKTWNLRSIQEVSREKKLSRCFKKGGLHFSPQKKKQWQDIFFSMEHRLLVAKEPLFWTFWEWEIRYFLRQKVSGKITFTGYWNLLVLNFSQMKNTVFFSKKVDGKMIFTSYWKVLVLNFSVMENTAFFEA